MPREPPCGSCIPAPACPSFPGKSTAFFSIDADGLVPSDTNGERDVYVRRFGSGVTGDVTGDALVDASDLAVLVSHWNGTDQSADLNGDGMIESRDLAILLGSWTPWSVPR